LVDTQPVVGILYSVFRGIGETRVMRASTWQH
jgi:hypothetical protein